MQAEGGLAGKYYGSSASRQCRAVGEAAGKSPGASRGERNRPCEKGGEYLERWF